MGTERHILVYISCLLRIATETVPFTSSRISLNGGTSQPAQSDSLKSKLPSLLKISVLADLTQQETVDERVQVALLRQWELAVLVFFNLREPHGVSRADSFINPSRC